MNQLYIVWQDDHNLGIPIIDEQHRGLVSTINTLYYNVSMGGGIEVLEPVLSILEHYIKVHFQLEESLMKKSGYPGYSQHVDSHHQLEMKAFCTVERAREYNDPYLLLKFLKNWWIRHINEEDRQFVPWIKALESGVEPMFYNDGINDSG
ncbi:MAG: bacteriohemerythrin [Endozoicomonas sp.]